MSATPIAQTEPPISSAPPSARTSQRRYDVDWLRILALGLLIVYHGVVSFQPWASLIYFPRNKQPLEGLWVVMSMINVWRIPILFLVSGMGVRFAMERRNWKQLLGDRTLRILVPFVFGFFFICPISIYVVVRRMGGEATYIPNAGHLWFLANIFLYVLLLLPLLTYLKKRPNHLVFRLLSGIFRQPLGLYLMALPVLAEAFLVKPGIYTMYVMTAHGFFLGMVCFLTGFLFVSQKDVFWPAAERIRWIALGTAVSLYLVRLFVFKLQAEPNWLIAIESMSWMLSILGFGSLYLNHSSRGLGYFSQAVYPVYIVHLPVQFILAYFLLPLSLPAVLKLILLLVGTFGASLLLYEYVLRRLKWIRPLFGMKLSPG